MWGIPWQSQVRNQLFHCSRAWVQTLIEELRSCAVRPKKKKTFVWLIYLYNLETDMLFQPSEAGGLRKYFVNQLRNVMIICPLYILAFLVKDKVSIGAWIYLWAFYFVPLIYFSVFGPVLYCLNDCSFVV